MKKIILLLLVLSSCCSQRGDGAKALYVNGKCVVIQENGRTLILMSGTGTDLTAGGHERCRQESVKPVTGMETDRKSLRRKLLSEAAKDAFQRANAAFDSIYPGWLRLHSYPVFLNGE